jgi:hypothetical protein
MFPPTPLSLPPPLLYIYIFYTIFSPPPFPCNLSQLNVPFNTENPFEIPPARVDSGYQLYDTTTASTVYSIYIYQSQGSTHIQLTGQKSEPPLSYIYRADPASILFLSCLSWAHPPLVLSFLYWSSIKFFFVYTVKFSFGFASLVLSCWYLPGICIPLSVRSVLDFSPTL